MSTVVLIIVIWFALCCLCCFLCKAKQDQKENSEDYYTFQANKKAAAYFNGEGSDQEY